MQNSVVMYAFSFFRPEIPRFGKFVQNNQNCQFNMKFGTNFSSNIMNSMMMLTFSTFDRKHPCGANLVQKFKLVSLSSN